MQGFEPRNRIFGWDTEVPQKALLQKYESAAALFYMLFKEFRILLLVWGFNLTKFPKITCKLR